MLRPSLLLYFSLYMFQTHGQTNNCECVPYYLCTNGTLNTNGENIIDIRINANDCPNYLDICCETEFFITDPKPRAVPTPSKKQGCGHRNPDGVGFRITGNFDNEAEFGEFPWMVAVLHKAKGESNYTYKCGGSIIHPQVVLTAAHCVVGTKSMKIRAGEWDTKTTQEQFQYHERKVESAVVHAGFQRRNLYNDVALLFLESPLDFNSYINATCLPPEDFTDLSDQCFVSGWGKDKFEQEGLYQNILKKIELPRVDTEKCQEDFRKTRLGRFFKLHRSFICAGGVGGKDSCTGDGGGPLVCPISGEEERYQQVGIVAWGIGCGQEGVPGAYVDVAYFRPWIDKQMKQKNFDVDAFEY